MAPPSLGSMTLDKDDVELARTLLKDKTRWTDSNIVNTFESKFAFWNGSKHAYAFMSGRVALSACISALGLQSGDEVIIPAYTCVVVPNAFKFAGIKIVYSDIELDTYGLEACRIEEKITAKTRAILLQHLFGLVCRDYDAIFSLALRHGLKVIEDCAHATGAEFKGGKVGNRGDVSFYSSEQSKVFNTVQGGIAVTNNDHFATKLIAYRQNAPLPNDALIERLLFCVPLNYYQQKDRQRWWKGDVAEIMYGSKRLASTTPEEENGICPAHYGCRMSPPIAALGLSQLAKIDNYNMLRRKTAMRWDSWCDQKGYKKAFVLTDSIPVFLRYPVMVEWNKKKDTSWAMDELGINPGVWFVGNIHPVNLELDDCPHANEAVKKCVNLPTLVN